MSDSKEHKKWPRSMQGDASDIVMLGKVVHTTIPDPPPMLSELELDVRFWTAIRQNADFRSYFLSRSKFSGRDLELTTDEKWHQRWYRSPETGKDSETDILLIFREGISGRRVAFHIENKLLFSRWELQQAENYRFRAINRMEKWNYFDYELVLMAPSGFITAHPREAGLFDWRLSYDEVGRYLPEFMIRAHG